MLSVTKFQAAYQHLRPVSFGFLAPEGGEEGKKFSHHPSELTVVAVPRQIASQFENGHRANLIPLTPGQAFLYRLSNPRMLLQMGSYLYLVDKNAAEYFQVLIQNCLSEAETDRRIRAIREAIG